MLCWSLNCFRPSQVLLHNLARRDVLAAALRDRSAARTMLSLLPHSLSKCLGVHMFSLLLANLYYSTIAM